jgi:hypothetical protein
MLATTGQQGVPAPCPMGREPRVNGGQLVDVAASVAAQVMPGRCRPESARVHTS